MDLKDFYRQKCELLKEKGIENPSLEVRIIIKHRLGRNWDDIITNSTFEIDKSSLKLMESDLQRRIKREPLSRIHGFREFYGLEFMLGPDTLDPRPETEILVDRALEIFEGQPPERILDLGTGSGCIIIALLKRWPESRGVAVDISPGALETAKINAVRHDVADRLEFICGSWGEGIEGPFDLIVSNPPYIAESDIESLDSEVRNHDPILALQGGRDGLEAYRKIFFDLPRLLKPAGKALLEIGAGQEADLVRLSRESRIRIIHTQADYAGIPRVVEISNGDK